MDRIPIEKFQSIFKLLLGEELFAKLDTYREKLTENIAEKSAAVFVKSKGFDSFEKAMVEWLITN